MEPISAPDTISGGATMTRSPATPSPWHARERLSKYDAHVQARGDRESDGGRDGHQGDDSRRRADERAAPSLEETYRQHYGRRFDPFDRRCQKVAMMARALI